MTNSLCVVCGTNPKDFVIVDKVLVCCTNCEPAYEKMKSEHLESEELMASQRDRYMYEQHEVNLHVLEGIKNLAKGVESLHKMLITLTEIVLGIDDIEQILNEEE